MRVLITLILVFFSHLFLNVAQASPHTNAEKKASTSTDDKQTKKHLAAKNSKKDPEPTKKKAETENLSSKKTPEKKTAAEKKAPEKKKPEPEKKTKAAPSSKGKATSHEQPEAKKTAAHKPEKTHTAPAASARTRNDTPAKLVKGLKKTRDEHASKTAAVKSGAKKNGKELVMSEAHKRRYQHAKMTAMNKLMSQIGKPYQWGGTSPYTGFDCSGLVYYAYKDVVKIPIPRTANEMYHLRDAAPIGKNELEIGDLVFFRINNRGTADHVGVYLGNGKFIQSPRTGADIKISKLSEDYWQEHYIGARRVVTPQTIR